MHSWFGMAIQPPSVGSRVKPDARIYVAGHSGLVGSALCRALEAGGFQNLITASHASLDLCRADQVEAFFAREQPQYVFLAAARVGGILANDRNAADFISINLKIAANVIEASHRHKVDRLLFLGSSCIYPRACPQPMREEHLLTGPLEPTNRAYAIAKIAGAELCRAFFKQHGCRFLTVMPTNLYGPGDSYDLQNSHVLPALIRKMHEARESAAQEVEIWGTGAPRREFLYSDDLAEACVLLMRLADADFDNLLTAEGAQGLLNVGCGDDLSIRDLAEQVRSVVGFAGKLRFNTDYPDGTPRKLLDISRIRALGWSPRTTLVDGITRAYGDFLGQTGSGER